MPLAAHRQSKQLATRKDRSAGFTIAETLIVLAIAGLILMLVFEAIPILVRNSRNNQRRQDVQLILGAVSHYELNNSGNVPSTLQLVNFLVQFEHLSYYLPPSSSNITVIVSASATNIITPINNTATLDTLRIYNHAKCDPQHAGGATNAGAGYDNVVALYAIERGSGGPLPQCQQL
jgi:type II secretory pathway pseudopilin PulG